MFWVVLVDILDLSVDGDEGIIVGMVLLILESVFLLYCDVFVVCMFVLILLFEDFEVI